MARSRPLFAAAVCTGVLAAAGLGIFLARGPLIAAWSEPTPPFDPAASPPAPDYEDPASWAALADRFDHADVVPPDSNLHARQERAAVDVFFLHPTTYFRGATWNAPIDDALTNLVTDRGVLPQQASVFNSSGRVFAPRYRQLTLMGYRDPDNRAAALDLAYGDVLRAFDTFVERHNDGRPILLAGHSQGSQHLLRLLGDRFRDGPLRKRLVAAYAIGTRVPLEPAPVVPVCNHAMSTGCLVAWQTILDPALAAEAEGERVGFDRRGPYVCVNPLTWRLEQASAGPEQNFGAIPLIGPFGLSALERAVAGARCEDGRLLLDRAPGRGFRNAVLPGGDYHAYDYNLFYANLRMNARNRAEGFTRSRLRRGRGEARGAPG